MRGQQSGEGLPASNRGVDVTGVQFHALGSAPRTFCRDDDRTAINLETSLRGAVKANTVEQVGKSRVVAHGIEEGRNFDPLQDGGMLLVSLVASGRASACGSKSRVLEKPRKISH